MIPLLLACHSSNNEDPQARIVVVVMDGVRAEESLGDRTSSATGLAPWEMMPLTWEKLVPQGARAKSALNTGITITAPAHCALTSGLKQPLANYAVEEEPGIYRPELPSVMEQLRTDWQIPREKLVVTGNTILIKPIAHSLWPEGGYESGADFVMVGRDGSEIIPAQSDAEVFDAIHDQLISTQPNFLIANLHSVDRAGHYGEGMDYPDHVEAIDGQLVRLWETMQSLPAYEDAWLIILSDHGRHRESETDPPWREHGDACMGCRHLPFLILGPDVNAGVSTDEPVILADVGVTVASLLDTQMPMSTGRFLSEMFLTTDDPAPLGVISVAAAGGVEAVEVQQDDAFHRSRIEVDGVVFSSPDALLAEAPVMAARDDERWLCFRELTVDLEADAAPWIPRCFWQSAGLWSEIAAPEETVSPLWRPALLASGPGQLTAAWSNNVNEHASPSGSLGPIGMVVGTFGGGSWQSSLALQDITFPQHPTLLKSDGEIIAAIAAAPGIPTARDSRQFYIASDTRAGLTQSAVLALNDLAPDLAGWRLERPALTSAEDGTLWLAGLGYSDQHTAVVLVSKSPSGNWLPIASVSEPGAVLPHIAPRWHDDTVIYGASQDDSAALCRASRSGAVDCLSLATPHLRELNIDGDTARVVVQVDGTWQVNTISLPW
ncbi:MAG: hypothetical protein ACI8RZ_002428 [Myxococcota bacterium]|jgi:hypothetical protein